jgi:hypothetical protein
MDQSPTSILSKPALVALHAQLHTSPAERHYELVLDIAEALAVASAIHQGQLVDLVEHLCLEHVAAQLSRSGRRLRIATVIPVDSCDRACIRCETVDSDALAVGS